MNAKHLPYLLIIISSLLAAADPAEAQSTAFTYQGQLRAAGLPANGYYDMQFGLYPTNSGGSQVGNLITGSGLLVTNGLFTVTLDFGNVFGGGSYWLEIAVRTNGSSGGFTTLAPRQNVSASPYSLYSLTAGNITGVLSATNLPANVALLNGNANFTGTVTAGNFTGNGAGLTNLSFAGVAQPNATGQGLLSSSGFTALNTLQMTQLTATPFKTPPMGWMSWNCCGGDGARESNCLNMAQYMINYGLPALGYNLIEIDAGWGGYRDTNGFIHESAARFPDGMSNTVATLHSLGFKVGIWHPLLLNNPSVDFVADNEAAMINTNFSNEQLLMNDARTFVNWGIDYVKLESFVGLLSGDQEQRWYELFAATAQSAGKPLYVMAAVGGSGPPGSDAFPWMYGVINARRSGAYDINNYDGSTRTFNQFLGNFWFASAHPEYSGPGCFISLDAIPAYDPAGPTYMLMIAMLNGELVWNWFDPNGAHLTDAAYLTNIIQLDQDPAALMARCVLTNGTVTVWQKPLGSPAGSTFALAFFNTATSGSPVSTTISLASLGATSPELLSLDLISNVTAVVSNSLTITVPAMTAYGFKLSPYIAPGVGGGNLAANTIVTAGNVAITGNVTAGSFTGNGGGLTNLNAAKLTGVAGLSTGGTGVNLGANFVPSGAIYDQTVDGGSVGPGYGITLTAGTTYMLTVPNNGNDLGLVDAAASNFYGPSGAGSGTFTVPSTGTYYLAGSANATPVLSTIRVFNTNAVVFGSDFFANNIFGTVGDTDLSTNVQFKNQPLTGRLSALVNGGSEHFISGENTANGSTLSIRRLGTTGYADVNFFTGSDLWFALGIAADRSNFPYDKPYLESYLSQYPFYFVGSGRVYGGLYAAPYYGDWVWYNNNVTSAAAEVAANEIFHVHSTNGITDILNAKVGHLIGSFNAPTVVTNSGAGLSLANVSLDANASDAAMTITLNTGTSPAAAATIFTIKFATPYATAPHLLGTPCPMNSAAALLNGATMIYVTTTTTNLTFTSGPTGLTGSSTYKWSLGLMQ